MFEDYYEPLLRLSKTELLPLNILAKYPPYGRVKIYFASEVNAHKSLGEVVRSTWYVVLITCSGRH